MSKKENYEEAVEIYKQAANSYKLDKRWDDAGNAYIEAVRCQEKAKEDMLSFIASNYVEAANCFEKSSNITSTTKYLDKAIEMYLNEGSFPIAAKLEERVGDILEKNMDSDSIKYYNKSCDHYECSDQNEAIDRCSLKMIRILVLRNSDPKKFNQDDFKDALGLYEKMISKIVVGNPSYRFKSCEYIFNALLIMILINTIDDVKFKLERYLDQNSLFEDSKEHKLIRNILIAFENNDSDEFSEYIKEYDYITKLSQDKINILLKIKHKLGENMVENIL